MLHKMHSYGTRLSNPVLHDKSLYDFKKEIKRKNNGRKIHQELPLSCKFLEVEGLFLHYLLLLVLPSPISICLQPAQKME